MRVCRTSAVAGLVLAVVVPAVRADVVHLRNGRTLEGTLEEEGETVRVRTAAGVVTLDRADIERIEKTRPIGEIYAEKLAALPAKDAQAAYELAMWCKEQGLRAEHEELIRRALAIDPQHAGALEVLRRALVQAPLPNEPERAAALQREFGPAFTVKQTGHYLLAYNCEQDFADRQAALLERLYQSFYGYFLEGQFALTPMRRRLVVVIFGSREEFAGHARTTLPAAAGTGGYYHPEANRCVFFAAHSGEEYAQASQAAGQLRVLIAAEAKAVPKLRDDLIRARTAGDREAVERAQQALDLVDRRRAQLARYEEAMRAVENSRVTIVLHEATHQLIFNTGLLRNPAGDPRWLHEGLAMLFESARAGDWRGSATPNAERLSRYRRDQAAGRLPALKQVLLRQEVFYEVVPGTLSYYASAWGLVYYLSERRRADFNAYLRLVAQHPVGPVRAEGRLRDFTQTFGEDLAGLEADWRAFMDRVRE